MMPHNEAGGQPMPRTADEREDRLLSAARDSFPDWEIMEALGGYVAVPKDTPLLQAITLDGLVARLRSESR